MPRNFPPGSLFKRNAPLGRNLSALADPLADSLRSDANNLGDGGKVAEVLGGALQSGDSSIHGCNETNTIAATRQALLQGKTAKGFVKSRVMKNMTIGERVRARREQLRLSTPQLAKKVGGITHQAIQALEKGGGTRHLVSIARALGVTPEWLQDGTGTPPLPPELINYQMLNTRADLKEPVTVSEKTATVASPRDILEVRGMAQGGPDGWNLWNGETIQVINRPDNLVGVSGAYGVLISGESMVPRYDPGMIVHVHPWRRPQSGDCVVVQRRPPHEGDAPLAVLKRLVRETGTKLVLEQLNPPKQFEVLLKDVVSFHLVVGSSSP